MPGKSMIFLCKSNAMQRCFLGSSISLLRSGFISSDALILSAFKRETKLKHGSSNRLDSFSIYISIRLSWMIFHPYYVADIDTHNFYLNTRFRLIHAIFTHNSVVTVTSIFWFHFFSPPVAYIQYSMFMNKWPMRSVSIDPICFMNVSERLTTLKLVCLAARQVDFNLF